MYKVFIYDKPVLIHNEPKKQVSYEQLNSVGDVNQIIYLLAKRNVQGVEIVASNPKKEWDELNLFFKYIIAAGGAVFNENGELLVIFRNDKWDLPKGKLEKGENIPACAIREVEEECGVEDLKIKKELPSTYHCYLSNKGNWILKRTYWYKMTSRYTGVLVPQKEEGIEKVMWFEKDKYDQIRANTYNSIKIVFDNLDSV